MLDVRVQLGAVIRLTAADRFRPEAGPIALWVTGVRLALNRPERDEWIWLEGVQMMHDGQSGKATQILVRASFLAPHSSGR